MGIWINSFGPITPDADVGYNNQTARQIIESAYLSEAGIYQTRVTFAAASSIYSWNIAKAYIGLAAAAGDTYDFAATPTQLLFGGSASVIVGAGTQVISDWAVFSRLASQNLIISSYHNSTSYSGHKVSQAGCHLWIKTGDDAATVDATGYSDFTSLYAMGGVVRVEVRVGSGLLGFIFDD